MSPLVYPSPANDGLPAPVERRGDQVGGPLTMPDDAGPGWLRSAMEAAASAAAAALAGGPVLAVAASKTAVHQDIVAGDVVRLHVDDVRYGTTSLTLSLTARLDGPTATRVAAADYSYIAVDHDGRPRPVLEPVAEACNDPGADSAAGDDTWTEIGTPST